MNDKLYLEEYRKRAGLTLRYVAEQLNVSQTTIHKWEQDQNLPSVRALCQLAKVYGIPAQTFFLRPDRATKETFDINQLSAAAAAVGIHPCAFVFISGDMNLMDAGAQFSRFVKAYEQMSPEVRDVAITLAEGLLRVQNKKPSLGNTDGSDLIG